MMSSDNPLPPSSIASPFPGMVGQVRGIVTPSNVVSRFKIRTRGSGAGYVSSIRYADAHYAAFTATHLVFYLEMPEGVGDRLVLAISADIVIEVTVEDPVDK